MRKQELYEAKKQIEQLTQQAKDAGIRATKAIQHAELAEEKISELCQRAEAAEADLHGWQKDTLAWRKKAEAAEVRVKELETRVDARIFNFQQEVRDYQDILNTRDKEIVYLKSLLRPQNPATVKGVSSLKETVSGLQAVSMVQQLQAQLAAMTAERDALRAAIDRMPFAVKMEMVHRTVEAIPQPAYTIGQPLTQQQAVEALRAGEKVQDKTGSMYEMWDDELVVTNDKRTGAAVGIFPEDLPIRDDWQTFSAPGAEGESAS